MQSNWQPIETAPKGGGAEMVTDQNYIDPPNILLKFDNGKQAVCHYDWYYPKDGCISGWVEPISGDQIALHYGEPTHWQPLPE